MEGTGQVLGFTREVAGRNQDTGRDTQAHEMSKERLDVVDLEAVPALIHPDEDRHSDRKTAEQRLVGRALAVAVTGPDGRKVEGDEPMLNEAIEVGGREGAKLGRGGFPAQNWVGPAGWG